VLESLQLERSDTELDTGVLLTQKKRALVCTVSQANACGLCISSSQTWPGGCAAYVLDLFRTLRLVAVLLATVLHAATVDSAAAHRVPTKALRPVTLRSTMGKKRPSANKVAEGDTSSSSKRRAAGGAVEELGSPLSPHVLEANTIKKFKSEFEKSAKKPYSHCILEDFCDKDRLRAVHDELVNNLTANLKESDLFKVYQVKYPSQPSPCSCSSDHAGLPVLLSIYRHGGRSADLSV